MRHAATSAPAAARRRGWAWVLVAVLACAAPRPAWGPAPLQRPQPVTQAAIAVAAVAGVASRPLVPGAAPTARALPADNQAEVCGLGIVRVDEDAPASALRIPQQVRELAWQRLTLWLARSGDPRQRAAAALLQLRLAVPHDALADAAAADAACRHARDAGLDETARACADAQRETQAALLAPAAGAVDALARLAVLSSDAQVTAFAVEACAPPGLGFAARPGNCQLVDASRWAQQAPDEAEPWLRLADEADVRSDGPAVDTALARAAGAGRIGGGSHRFVALLAAALPAGMPALERSAVLSELATLAPLSTDGLPTIARVCSDTALATPGRAASCAALAQLLVERGSSAAAVTAGVQLGERLGWPAERTGALLRAQRAALDAALRYTTSAQPLSCNSLERLRERVLLEDQLGEIEAAHELLRREGMAPARR